MVDKQAINPQSGLVTLHGALFEPACRRVVREWLSIGGAVEQKNQRVCAEMNLLINLIFVQNDN